MRNYRDNDEDFKLVPMKMKGNTEYSFMPMNNKPIFKQTHCNNMPMNHSNNCCCCMHKNMIKSSPCYSNCYPNQMFSQNHSDSNMMVKTLITVKKKSELFD